MIVGHSVFITSHWKEIIGDRNIVQSHTMIINQLPFQLELDFEAAAYQKSDNGLGIYKFDRDKLLETQIFVEYSSFWLYKMIVVDSLFGI